MTDYRTPQEAFWTGPFGDAYMDRNAGDKLVTAKTVFFGRALRGLSGVSSICEFGCNIGLNLQALRTLGPYSLTGIEIHPEAARRAAESGVARISNRSILEDISDEGRFDLTFTMGVLIHINPDHLATVYDNLVRCSQKYVFVGEYYNPTPVSVTYRGHEDRLFKRDFAGELMERHGLELVDYGFQYRRDNIVPMDDINWFLLRKPGA